MCILRWLCALESRRFVRVGVPAPLELSDIEERYEK